MSDSQTPLPPAGWYADPENAAGERWWNGVAWGEERRGKDAVPPIPVPPVAAAEAAVPEPVIAETSVVTESPASADVGVAAPAAAVVAEPAPYVAPVSAPVDDRPNPYAAPDPYAAPAPYVAPAPAPGYEYQPAAYTGAYAPRPGNPNVVALVGFIIAMASIILNFVFTGLVGIAGGIVSAIGLAKANRLERQGITPTGKGFALAGTIVGFAGGALTFIGFIALMAFSFAFAGY